MSNYQPRQQTCPGCGGTFAGLQMMAAHKRECEALEQAIYDEVARLSEALGMAVSMRQYDRQVDKALPRSVWIYNTLGDWKEILHRAGWWHTVCIECGFDAQHPRSGLCRACYCRQYRQATN